MADNSFKLFGFEIKRAKKVSNDLLPSVVPPLDQDGAGYVTAAGAHYGTYVDVDGDKTIKDERQLILQYRAVATHPEVDAAVEDIVNESVSSSQEEQSVAIVLDKVEIPDNIKKTITDEFDNIYSLCQFAEQGHDMFKRWYVDGRMYHHLVIDEKNPKAGIQEIRPIDASKIRKVKQIQKEKIQILEFLLLKMLTNFISIKKNQELKLKV